MPYPVLSRPIITRYRSSGNLNVRSTLHSVVRFVTQHAGSVNGEPILFSLREVIKCLRENGVEVIDKHAPGDSMGSWSTKTPSVSQIRKYVTEDPGVVALSDEEFGLLVDPDDRVPGTVMQIEWELDRLGVAVTTSYFDPVSTLGKGEGSILIHDIPVRWDGTNVYFYPNGNTDDDPGAEYRVEFNKYSTQINRSRLKSAVVTVKQNSRRFRDPFGTVSINSVL